MIKLHRLNNQPFILNSELIQFIEETPDTIITLTNRDKIMVKEKMDDVIHSVIEYCRQTRAIPMLQN